MNNFITTKESVFMVGLNNDNYLGIDFQSKKKLSLHLDHSFFIEKIKYQLYNLGIKYPIYNKPNFDLTIQNSFFGNYRNLTRLIYFSPEIIYWNKNFNLALKIDLHKKFLTEPKYNLQFQIPLINSLIVNNYVLQSRHSYYSLSDHKIFGSELQYFQNNLLAKVGFETFQDLNLKFIQFKIGLILFIDFENSKFI